MKRRQSREPRHIVLDLIPLFFAEVQANRVGDVRVVLDQSDALDRPAAGDRRRFLAAWARGLFSRALPVVPHVLNRTFQ
jgi:hypothetical protein